MGQPAVSVIVPSYNSATYLPRALQSLIDQTLDPHEIEIIVVDDGSSDDIARAIAPYEARIRLIRIEHAGVSAARNAGISTATGRYVTFLDADDVWLPERLEAVLALALSENDTLCSTDFYYETDGVRSAEPEFQRRGMLSLFRETARVQYRTALVGNFLPYCQLLRRDILGRIGAFDTSLSYGEDYDLWLRCLKAGIPARVDERPLAIYRFMRPGASTTRNDVKKAADRVTVLERRRRDVPTWRWAEATGYLNHVRLRDAIQQRRYAEVVSSSFALARNPRYVEKWIRSHL